ncbi:E3 ubiquitin protein like protein [Tanacetum coccineum]
MSQNTLHRLFTLTLLFNFVYSKQPSTIYEILRSNGLPMGLLPKGVTNYTIDNSGYFQVYLDQACNSKFENEFHYDENVSGVLSFGQIDGVNGISAQDLFMWFNVKEIRVDVPSSGLIYFDVGVVHKQFSLGYQENMDTISTTVKNIQWLHYKLKLWYIESVTGLRSSILNGINEEMEKSM